MISAVCIYSGRLSQFQESLASFLTQDYEDRELLVVNTCARQTLVFDHPKVRLFNLKEFSLPMAAKTWAMNHVRGDTVIAWDEMAVALPGFLTTIAEAVKDRPWCHLDMEWCYEGLQVLKPEASSEFSFAFKTEIWSKCGPYPPGINGACDRNLIGKITKLYPGAQTTLHNDNINLIHLWNREERERIQPDIRCGQIRLNPVLTRDYSALVELARTGKRESRLCVVELGRYGDILNILPVLKHIYDNYEKPHLMVSAEFADLLEGCSYVEPFVTSLKNEKLGSALEIAKQSFQIVLNAGVWGEGHIQKKCTRSYNMDSWNNTGYLRFFDNADMRPMFDRRDADREHLLLAGLRGYDTRPMMLVNVSKAVSSPCAHCAELLAEIQKVWDHDYHVVNLAEHRAHRLYDFIGVFEAAACLISLDTSFIHLATATDIPVVALTNPKGDGWASTVVRCGNLIHAIPYDKVQQDNRRELHESIAAALERGNRFTFYHEELPPPVHRRIFHLVDRFEESDKHTLDRKWKCQQTWDRLYENGSLIPVHCWQYPRNARDTIGDPRPLPYLKDLLAHGMNQCADEDIVLWSNDDQILHPEIADYIRYHVSCHGPCSIFRTEFRGSIPSLDLSPENFGKRSTEKHIGRDGFAFTKRWLREHWDEIGDYILAASMWDVALTCLIRLHYGIKTTNQNIWQQMLPAEIPAGYVGHIAHLSAWSVNQNSSPANRHNGEIFLKWADENLPDLRVTLEGNLV